MFVLFYFASCCRSMIFSLTPSKKLFCVASAANTVFTQLDKGGVKVQTVGAGEDILEAFVHSVVSLIPRLAPLDSDM